MEANPMQLVEVGDVHQPTRSDDADAVAQVLDLGKDVRGKEDSRSILASFGGQVEELLLVEGVKAIGRLVEDQEWWLVHERDDDPELPLVAAGVFAISAAEVEAESFGPGSYDLEVRAAPQRTQVRDHLGGAPASEL